MSEEEIKIEGYTSKDYQDELWNRVTELLAEKRELEARIRTLEDHAEYWRNKYYRGRIPFDEDMERRRETTGGVAEPTGFVESSS